MKLADKRILVTGGAGFIGSHITEHLHQKGADIHVLDDFSSGDRSLLSDKATFERIDIRSKKSIEAIQQADPDGIVHLGALHYIPYCNDNPEETFEVNVLGTRNVLEGARRVDGLEALVYTSTAAVYPPTESAVSEHVGPDPMDIYGGTKLAGEDLLRLFSTETGVPAASIRLFNTYGTNETNPHLIPEIVTQAVSGTEIQLGNLTPRRDFIHVHDVKRAVSAILQGIGGHEVYNVGTGEAYSVEEVASRVIEIAETNMEIVQEQDRVRESDRPHLQADISKIRTEIGWEPEIDLSEGLRNLYSKVKNNKRAII